MKDDGLVGGNNGLGGVNIQGYGKTATKYENIIKNLSVTNSYGASGACNLLVSRYVEISNIQGKNISTGTIDGNGILVDLYNSNVKVSNIDLENVLGKDGIGNSGAAVMVLGDTDHVHVTGVRSKRSKVGVYNGDVNYDSVHISDCEFLECTYRGIHNNSRAWPKVFNNKFTGYGDSSTEIVSTQVNTNLVHGYNSFIGFKNPMVNQTLNATESRSRSIKHLGAN